MPLLALADDGVGVPVRRPRDPIHHLPPTLLLFPPLVQLLVPGRFTPPSRLLLGRDDAGFSVGGLARLEGGVVPDPVLVAAAVGVELALRGRDVDALEQIPGERLDLLEVIVPVAGALELVLAPVEDGRDAAPDVDLAFDLQVLERLPPEADLAEGAGAAGNGAGGRAVGEDAVDAGFAHFVVAFRVHEETHGGVEVAGGFADGADVCGNFVLLSAIVL